MKKLLTISLLALMATVNIQSAYATTQTRVHINGLVCDFCARALEKVFSKQPTVEKIEVDLNQKIVTILFKEQSLPEDVMRKLITNAGYNVERFEHAE